MKKSFLPHSTFIRANRAEIKKLVWRRTGEYLLTLDAILDDIIDRCRALRLRANGSARLSRAHLIALLTSNRVHSLYSSRRRLCYAV